MEERPVTPRNDECYDAAYDVVVHLFEIHAFETSAY